MSTQQDGLTYADAGVHIAKAEAAVKRMQAHIKRTHHDYVLDGEGGFCGLFDLASYLQEGAFKDPVLGFTIDGAGTVTQVAHLAREIIILDGFVTIGWNLAQHCFADLATSGADPILLVDAISSTDVDPDVHESIVKGMAEACYAAGVRLVGGETAQMPGIIVDGQTDVMAAAVGIAERDLMLRPHRHIQPGAVLIGIASNGLLLNGFSLARKILFDCHTLSIADELPGMGTVGSALLRKQPNYAALVWSQLHPNQGYLWGAAHITGGGLYDNIARILPKGCRAVINASAWEVPEPFRTLQELGRVADEEAYRTWNMGIGFVEVIDPQSVDWVLKELGHHHNVYRIGEVVEGNQEVTINFDK